MNILARVYTLLNYQRKNYNKAFFHAIVMNSAVLSLASAEIIFSLIIANIMLVSASTLPISLLIITSIGYVVLSAIYSNQANVADTNPWYWLTLVVNTLASLLWFAVIPSSILSYVVFGSLMLVCAASFGIMRRSESKKETPQVKLVMFASIFLFLFLANLPIPPILLSTAVIPMSLLVATIALCAWLSVLIFAPTQPTLGKKAVSRIPAFYLGIVMLTGILTFCGLQNMGLYHAICAIIHSWAIGLSVIYSNQANVADTNPWYWLTPVISILAIYVIPSSILSYVLFGSLTLVCAASFGIMRRSESEKETPPVELVMFASIFLFLFLANLPITPILLSTAVIPTSLLVAAIALCAWLSVLTFAPPQPTSGKKAVSRIPAFYLGIVMLTGIITFCGLQNMGLYHLICAVIGDWALASLSPLAQSTTLFFFLLLASRAAKHIGAVWDKLWFMDSMISENHQVKNLHFNFLYCFIAHVGALVFSVADLYSAFSNPKQYIQRIGAHCQFLATRTWHFFYLHLVNPIESCLYTDKNVKTFTDYRTQWEFDHETGKAPTIKVITTGQEAFNQIQRWERADAESIGVNKLGDANNIGQYSCSLQLFPA